MKPHLTSITTLYPRGNTRASQPVERIPNNARVKALIGDHWYSGTITGRDLMVSPRERNGGGLAYEVTLDNGARERVPEARIRREA